MGHSPSVLNGFSDDVDKEHSNIFVKKAHSELHSNPGSHKHEHKLEHICDFRVFWIPKMKEKAVSVECLD